MELVVLGPLSMSHVSGITHTHVSSTQNFKHALPLQRSCFMHSIQNAQFHVFDACIFSSTFMFDAFSSKVSPQYGSHVGSNV